MEALKKFFVQEAQTSYEATPHYNVYSRGFLWEPPDEGRIVIRYQSLRFAEADKVCDRYNHTFTRLTVEDREALRLGKTTFHQLTQKHGGNQ